MNAGRVHQTEKELTLPTSIPNVILNNGIEMPILGFGVYQTNSRLKAPSMLHVCGSLVM